jgi:ankyrin repeat protein
MNSIIIPKEVLQKRHFETPKIRIKKEYRGGEFKSKKTSKTEKTKSELLIYENSIKESKILIKRDADLTYANSSALLVSVKIGNLEKVKLLIERGADPCFMNNLPLLRCCENGRLSIIKYLINLGNYYKKEIISQSISICSEYEHTECKEYLNEYFIRNWQ